MHGSRQLQGLFALLAAAPHIAPFLGRSLTLPCSPYPHPPFYACLQLHCCLESLSPTPRITEAMLLRPSTRAKSAAQGVSWVLRSLTSSHKSVLAMVLAGIKAGKPHTVDSLLKLCKQGMVVRNAVELRDVVTELTDHGIISQQAGVFKLKASGADVEAALKKGQEEGGAEGGGAGSSGAGAGAAGGWARGGRGGGAGGSGARSS